MSNAYATEKQLAVAAVRRACTLTSNVFNKLVKNETLTKNDKTPVTGKVHPPLETTVILTVMLQWETMLHRLLLAQCCIVLFLMI